MAIQHDERSAVADIVPSRSRRPRRGRRIGRTVAAGAAAVAVVAGGAGAVWYAGVFDHKPSTDTKASVTVPEKVGGLAAAPQAQDFSSQPAWQEKAQAAVGGATVIGRQYGSAKARKTIRVVAARADLTGKLELKWPADKGEKVGDARCTQNFKLTETGTAKVRPTMLMCWRTSDTFSAYSIVIDFDHKPKAEDAVQAIDDIWGKA
ncbi:MAG: hypothetical protein HY830_18330 [Actinobacteria bacterium]|nr:hypothetical protein [Actinomycetota bacterium]